MKNLVKEILGEALEQEGSGDRITVAPRLSVISVGSTS